MLTFRKSISPEKKDQKIVSFLKKTVETSERDIVSLKDISSSSTFYAEILTMT